MVEQLAVNLSDILIRWGTAEEKERPFLVYGLFCMLSGTLQILLLLVFSLLFHNTVQVALYSFCFGILKRTVGGWHARHHVTCLTLFTSLALAAVWCSERLGQMWVLPVTILLAAVMLVIVWRRAPVEHPNNPQTPKRLAELKAISRRIAGAEAAGIIAVAAVLSGTSFYRLMLSAAMGAFTAAFALLIPNALPAESQKGGTDQ